MDAQNETPPLGEGSDDDASSESSTQKGRSNLLLREPIKKFSKKSVLIISAVTGFLGLILGATGGAFNVWDTIWAKHAGRKTQIVCQDIYNTAREYARKGDFAYSSRILNGQVDIYPGVKVLEKCEQNDDVLLLRHEVNLLSIVSQDYQFKVRETSQTEQVNGGQPSDLPPAETMDDKLKL